MMVDYDSVYCYRLNGLQPYTLRIEYFTTNKLTVPFPRAQAQVDVRFKADGAAMAAAGASPLHEAMSFMTRSCSAAHSASRAATLAKLVRAVTRAT